MTKLLGNRFFLVALVLSMVFGMTAFMACASGDDDDDDDDDTGDDDVFADDDASGDDDATDDDATDDDATDDDADDDSGSGTAPVLGGGLWDPDPAADDGTGAIVSTLVWNACDAEDDLSGGQIFVWITGTQTAALQGDVFWDDFTSGAPSAPDCGAPVDVGIGVDYGIYIYSRLESFLRAGLPLQEAYYETLKPTGKAVLFTGLCLAIGVATWMFSAIKFQADMGLMLTFMFIVNMFGALWLLPALARFLIKPEKLAGKVGGSLLAH